MEEQREVINTKEILAHPNAYEEKTQTEIDKESSEDTNRPVASDSRTWHQITVSYSPK